MATKLTNDESLSSGFSYDEQLVRARWYKEDFEKGGWKDVHKDENSTFWMKTFPNEEIPLKVLFEYKMPLSAEQFSEVFSPQNMKYRQKWDSAFLDNEILEETPEGHVTTNRVKLSLPFSDRTFVLFIPAVKEIEWYGKRAIYNGCVNTSHPSRPANVGGYVRAENGGNFYIAIPDDKDPEKACNVFGLTHSNYNGWLPKSGISMEWLLARSVPAAFCRLFEGIVQGHKMFFANI